MNLFAQIAALEAAGERAVLVTVVKATGSTPRAPGARMLVLADGTTLGTVGGGRIEHEAVAVAQDVFRSGEARLIEHALTQSLGMCCGGSMTLFLEPIGGAPKLIIFGAGHVGAALCKIALATGFVVHVADERDELLTQGRLPQAVLHPDLDDPALPFGPNTFVMVTTHDHALDQQLVEKALKKDFGWLGLIGSRRKAELTRERLSSKGFSAERIARVRSPVGLAIGAETPEEIAVSILAELVAVRRGAVPLAALEHKAKR